MPKTKVFSVVGLQNSGKTRLVQRMLAQFSVHQLRVAVIKHDGHAVPEDVGTWQKAGSDTQLFAEGGALYTLLAGGQQTLLYNAHDADAHNPVKLLQRLQLQADLDGAVLDVILVEGFKQSSIPKIAVVRTEAQLDWLIYEKLPALVAVMLPNRLIHLAHPTWRVYHEDDTVGLCKDLLELDGGE